MQTTATDACVDCQSVTREGYVKRLKIDSRNPSNIVLDGGPYLPRRERVDSMRPFPNYFGYWFNV